MTRPTVSDVGARLARQTGSLDYGWVQDDSSNVIYKLRFDGKTGFDWCKSQVKEVQNELDEGLQMWKIQGIESGRFMITVKELEPRYDIDDSQTSFGEYE